MCTNLNNLKGYKIKAIPEGFSSTRNIKNWADSTKYERISIGENCELGVLKCQTFHIAIL